MTLKLTKKNRGGNVNILLTQTCIWLAKYIILPCFYIVHVNMNDTYTNVDIHAHMEDDVPKTLL